VAWPPRAADIERARYGTGSDQPSFGQGGQNPRKYTADSENISPPLRWSGTPDDTGSFVLLCNDPDAPGGIFRHWAVYDIPPDRLELKEGHGPETLRGGLRQAINDFERPGYGGPGPPKGDGAHHYHFRLMALSESSLPHAPHASCEEVEAAAERHVFAETGTPAGALPGRPGRGRAMMAATMPSIRSVDLCLAGLRLPAGSWATATLAAIRCSGITPSDRPPPLTPSRRRSHRHLPAVGARHSRLPAPRPQALPTHRGRLCCSRWVLTQPSSRWRSVRSRTDTIGALDGNHSCGAPWSGICTCR
jgi:Raf kinase inhibitor-like YbhB/YbcL family protein